MSLRRYACLIGIASAIAAARSAWASSCDGVGAATTDGASALVALRDGLAARACGAAALPGGGTIRTSRMPAQSPASRIGAPIGSFIPAGAPVVERVEGRATGPGTSSQASEWLDSDGDGAGDVRVNTTYAPDGPRRSVHFTQADGTRVTLWEGESGRVDWEQRGWPGEPFENSFDRNDDGILDDLRTGCPGRPVTIYLLDPGAADRSPRAASNPLGVDPALLQMPHAVVPETDPMRLVWHEDIEHADVQVRVDLASAVPALSPELLARVTGVTVTGNWLEGGGRATVRRDGSALLVDATGVDGGAWIGKAPILRLALAGGGEQLVAFMSPTVQVDDTAPVLAGERSSVDSLRTELEIQRKNLATADASLANVTTRWDSRIADVRERIARADEHVAGLRTAAKAAWDAAPEAVRLSTLESLAGAPTLTAGEATAAAAALELARESGVPDAATLDPAVADLALAYFEHARDPASPFVAAVQESRTLRLDDLPRLLGYAATERAQNEVYWKDRRDYALGQIASHEHEIAEREARIAAYEAGERSTWTTSSGHTPYTF